MLFTTSLQARELLEDRMSNFALDLVEVMNEFETANLAYIHLDFPAEFDRLTQEFQAIDSLISDPKMKFDFRAFFLMQSAVDYKVVRYFNEGSYEDIYPKDFYEDLRRETIRSGKRLKRADYDVGDEVEALKDLKKYKDRWFQKLGNRVVSKIVDFLGRICKRRKLVPSLNWRANFRENYLITYQDETLESLLAPGGMQIGDIILEKDKKANTDALIPGYWTHTAMYLGTIKEFKAMGLWDDPRFAPMKESISSYRSDKKKKRLLKQLKKLKESWDDVAWYVESGRGGVEVYPMRFFLKTDGMAVMRPPKNALGDEWSAEDGKQIALRANRYMGLAYDFNHSNNSKFEMNCSEFVMRVYEFVTLPTGQSLSYLTVAPDDYAKAVKLGTFQLIHFYDYKYEGQKTYDINDATTYHYYEDFLLTDGR